MGRWNQLEDGQQERMRSDFAKSLIFEVLNQESSIPAILFCLFIYLFNSQAFVGTI